MRGDVAVLGATVNLTWPLPVPSAPAVMVIHDVLVVAVHAQPVVVVTVAVRWRRPTVGSSSWEKP